MITRSVCRKASLLSSFFALSRVFASFEETVAMSSSAYKVVDSHLHVWANEKEASSGFPYSHGQDPPESLKNEACVIALLRQMDDNGVDGALIVQPINHKFDHSYVTNAIKMHPDRFKGMLLHDPSLDEAEAIIRLEELNQQGFVGVRFNPYLWGPSSSMSQGAGLAVYKRCGELRIPVGVMCFKGLSLHFEDILNLLKASPETVLILDHFGFTKLDSESSSDFDNLVKLAQYPQVIVKISALFRLGDDSPYEKVRKDRFLPLLKAFGAGRLMVGSDFPFVLEQPERYGTIKLVSSWLTCDEDRKLVMGGTAERVFGEWNAQNTKNKLVSN